MSVHDGHRQRLKERFLRQGLDGFTDIQILELLLFYAIPRQEYWSGFPFPPPQDFPDSGFEPMSPAVAGSSLEPPGKPSMLDYCGTIH